MEGQMTKLLGSDLDLRTGNPQIEVSLHAVKLGVDLNDLISRWCHVLTESRICGCKNVRDLVINTRCLVVLEVDTSFRSILFRIVLALKFLRVFTKSKLRFPMLTWRDRNICPCSRRSSTFYLLWRMFRLGSRSGRLNAIRIITLFDQYMMCISDVAVAFTLISRSPNLEELVIHVRLNFISVSMYIPPLLLNGVLHKSLQFMYGWERGPYNLEDISEIIMSYDERFQHLRTVTLHGLMGSPSEKEFMKILLARASVLEDLHIFTDVDIIMSDVKGIF
ncbi:hypothetical protein LINPERHAP1_LOCUS31268 [Linum perenne]